MALKTLQQLKNFPIKLLGVSDEMIGRMLTSAFKVQINDSTREGHANFGLPFSAMKNSSSKSAGQQTR
jgi:hypothetical protein